MSHDPVNPNLADRAAEIKKRPVSQTGNRPAGSRPAAQRTSRAEGSGTRNGTRPPVRRTSAKPQAKRSGYQPKFAAAGKGRGKSPRDPRMPAILSALLLGSLALVILSISLVSGPSEPIPEGTAPEVPTLATEPPVIPHEVSSATLSVTGDLLPHRPIYSEGSVVYKGEQDYDFSPVFQYLKGYTDVADYAVANLETTLFGPEKEYTGNPKFNTPDQIVDGARGVGFDMLLTANNHCNDTGIEGVFRTIQVVREKGLAALGTNLDSSEQKYQIVDLNGIKVGMLCYSYEDSQNTEQVTFNYNPLPRGKNDLVCAFPKFTKAKSRDTFYEALSQQMSTMRIQGADVIVLFLHWGEEYELLPSADQREMAQKLCDLGVDLIIGGHPHVVEPVELMTSKEDPNRKTVCLYSLGNAFSNQRREAMNSAPNGHTEDGMLYNVTFKKYSDDSVYVSQVEIIPTWVNKHENSEGKREYNIVPLEESRRDQWQADFNLEDGAFGRAIESYNRTMNIVRTGLEESNSWLSSRLPQGQKTPAETTVPEAS